MTGRTEGSPEGLPARSIRQRFKELASETVVYGLTHAISKSAAILLVPVYTRVFTPSEFGVLDVLIVTTTLLTLFIQLELHSALARYFYGYERSERPVVVSTIVWTVLVLGLVVTALGTIAAGWADRWIDHPFIARYLRLTIVNAFGTSLFSVTALQLRLERRRYLYSAVHLVNTLLSVGLSIYLVVGLEWGIEGALWGQLIGSWAAAVITAFSIRHFLTRAFSPTLLRKSLRFSVPTIPGIAAGWIRRYGDRAIILLFLSTNALGIYALGAKIALIPRLLIQSLTLSWLPFSMSLLGDRDQNEIYARSLRYYVLVLGSLGVIVAAVGPELIALFGTSAYRGAERVVGWLAGAAIVAGAGMILWIGAMVKERTEVSSIASWAGAAAVLAIMAALVPLFGIDGAAVAVFIGSVVQITVMFRMSQKLHPIEFAVRPALLNLGTFVVFMILLYVGAGLPRPSYAALRAVGTIAYLIVAVVTLLTRSEREWFRRALIGRVLRRHANA